MCDHSSRTVLANGLQQPTRAPGPELAHVAPLFGLAPGGVCRAASVTGRAVRSCRTLSPLPAPKGVGGLLSVALSLGSPPPDVIRHRGSVEPGLSSAMQASTRPPDPLALFGVAAKRPRASLQVSGGVSARASACATAVPHAWTTTKLCVESGVVAAAAR